MKLAKCRNRLTINGYVCEHDGDIIASSPLPGQTDPNNLLTRYTYDAMNRPVELISTRSGQTLLRQQITYTRDSQRDTILETRNDGSVVFLDYDYDNLNRLVSEYRDVHHDGELYESDEYWRTFAFDLANNRLRSETSKYGHRDYGFSETDLTISTYNQNDQLSQTQSSLAGLTTFLYDAHGSLISETSPTGTKISHWDLRNRLLAIDTNGDGDLLDVHDISNITYDHDGVRVARTLITPTGPQTTLYLQEAAGGSGGSGGNPTGYSQVFEQAVDSNHDGSIQYEELLDTQGRSYVLGLRVEAQSDVSAMWQGLLHDVHGSTRALVNLDGTIFAGGGAGGTGGRFDYDAHGNALNFNPAAIATAILYTNQFYDAGAGQYHLRARSYRPDLGIFTSLDPYAGNMSDPLSLHKYLYTHGNPVMGIDPSGRMTLGELSVAISLSSLLVFILPSSSQQSPQTLPPNIRSNPDWNSPFINCMGAALNSGRGLSPHPGTPYAKRQYTVAEYELVDKDLTNLYKDPRLLGIAITGQLGLGIDTDRGKVRGVPWANHTSYGTDRYLIVAFSYYNYGLGKYDFHFAWQEVYGGLWYEKQGAEGTATPVTIRRQGGEPRFWQSVAGYWLVDGPPMGGTPR